MDRQVVAQKLESLRRCVERVEGRRPASSEQLRADVDAQDIIALNLTRAVQLCIDLGAHWLAENAGSESPRSMGQVFESLAEAGVLTESLSLRLRKAVGFRNVVIHNYDVVNWEIVHAICTEQLDDFRAFARVFSDLIDHAAQGP